MTLQKQIDHLQKDLGNIAEATTSLVVTKASGAKDVVLDRGGDALDFVVSAIKKRPLAAIGIAFGLGYLAMRLTHRPQA